MPFSEALNGILFCYGAEISIPHAIDEILDAPVDHLADQPVDVGVETREALVELARERR